MPFFSRDGSNVVTLLTSDLHTADVGRVVNEFSRRRRSGLQAPLPMDGCLHGGNIFTGPCAKGTTCPAFQSHGRPATVSPQQRAEFLNAANVHFRT